MLMDGLGQPAPTLVLLRCSLLCVYMCMYVRYGTDSSASQRSSSSRAPRPPTSIHTTCTWPGVMDDAQPQVRQVSLIRRRVCACAVRVRAPRARARGSFARCACARAAQCHLQRPSSSPLRGPIHQQHPHQHWHWHWHRSPHSWPACCWLPMCARRVSTDLDPQRTPPPSGSPSCNRPCPSTGARKCPHTSHFLGRC
jgi:hypothetical protein